MRLPTLVRFFLFFSIFFTFLLIGSQIKSANAQNNYDQSSSPAVSSQANYATPNTTDEVPKNLHTYTQNVMIETMAALACQLSGVDPTQPDGRCLGTDPATGKIGYVKNDGGAIGFMSNAITVLYTPPAHTADYVRYIASNFGITKNTHAAIVGDFVPIDGGGFDPGDQPGAGRNGSGFEGIEPLLNIWSIARNFSYLVFVLVFVVIGIAIMFRVKIDPRTVMTIQNQIPKIIIGLLLVTFSFAIAGFLIDIMWIFIYLFFSVFNGISDIDVGNLHPQNIVGTTPLGAVGLSGGVDIAKDGAGAIIGIISGYMNNAFGGVLGNIFGGLLGSASPAGLVGGLIGGVAGSFIPIPGVGTITGAVAGNVAGGIIGNILGIGGGGSVVGLLGGVIAFLIIAIALLWALIRVWFTLIMAYIAILLGVIFAPFWIIGGLVPGSKVNFTGWIRMMVANLAAFPTTLVMFLLGKTLMDTFSGQEAGRFFVPPFIGNPGDSKTFVALIGLGVILTIPNVVKMMKDTFGANQSNEPSPIGQAISVGAGVPGRIIGGAADSVTTVHVDKAGNPVYPNSVLAKAIRAFRGH